VEVSIRLKGEKFDLEIKGNDAFVLGALNRFQEHGIFDKIVRAKKRD
jgi:hypothetical protein